MLDVGLLDGEDVLGPVEALRPPAAGDRLLELVPVRLGEGARGKMVDHQPLALVTALRNASLLASDHRVSGVPFGVSL